MNGDLTSEQDLDKQSPSNATRVHDDDVLVMYQKPWKALTGIVYSTHPLPIHI